MKRTLALTAAALATTLTLAACGGGDDTATPAASGGSSSSSSEEATPAEAEFSEADVMFAQMMIPHHAQAVQMSDVLLAKDGVGDDVRGLAEQIKAAQAPEIELMAGWLEDWGAEVPPMDGMAMGGESGGMDMGGEMNGMMSPEDMQALEDATGTDAARLFLEQMTAHHEGAVEMAGAEVDGGTSPEAIELAETIVETQQAEIQEMQDLLAGL